MAVNRRQFPASVRRFFTQFDTWHPDTSALPNAFANAERDAELRAKAAAYPEILENARKTLAEPWDPTLPWDKLVFISLGRMANASLYFRFTGDISVLDRALEALSAFEACDRPHYTFSTCLGVMDIDLRSAEVTAIMAEMRLCFAGHLSPEIEDRLAKEVIERGLKPGLHAMRTKQYAWMHSKANWRVIITSMYALAAVVYSDRYPEWRELVDYGLEGTLVSLGTGDESGGWNEGPGYWDYGLGYAVRFAWFMKYTTGNALDLYQLPFLEKTGDFRIYMQPNDKELWNWSDCSKTAGSSQTLLILAQAYQRPAYQNFVFRGGAISLQSLFYLDNTLSRRLEDDRPLPLTKHFKGLGVVVARTGFKETDTYVGMKAADIPHYNHHCQMDGGSVVIHAAGRELLAEMEHWHYPREASKDPNAKRPSRPGLWDEELKRYKRWDLDSVSAHGHNSVVIEGAWPKAILHQPPILTVTSPGKDHDIFRVDSSVYYRPVANRVVRTVVYLRPDVVLFIDEIRAPKAIRARLQFHYHEAGEITPTGFRIANGPALLLGHFLQPLAEGENLIVGKDQRQTVYESPHVMHKVRQQYLYVENLWRQKRLVFITAMQAGAAIPGATPEDPTTLTPATFTLTGDPAGADGCTVDVVRGELAQRVSITARGVKVSKR